MLSNGARNLLLATCLAAAPTFALAQSPAQQRAQPIPTQAQQSQMSGKFLAVPLAGQMRAADLRSADIYTADNQKVGDIDDILLDHRGSVIAVVVGVGGFLGIGEKNVAIPFESLEIPDPSGAMASTINGGPATTGTVPDRNLTDAQRQRTTAQRAEEMSNQQANRQAQTATPQRTAQAPTGLWKPERILLKNVTKADLQNAPEFNWDDSTRDRSNTTNAPSRGR